MTGVSELLPQIVDGAGVTTWARCPRQPVASCEAHERPEPVIRKYVVCVDGIGAECVLVFDQVIEHAAAVPKGFRPVSAGFCCFAGQQLHVPPNIGSDTLGLDPARGDKERLINFFGFSR